MMPAKHVRRALLFCGLFLMMTPCQLLAQARSTASGPGGFIAVGGGVSAFATDYGQQTLAGGFAFADLHPTWRVGIELEARQLRLHNAEQLKQANYLAGVRVTLWPTGLSPYVKFLAGDGHIDFPFGYGKGDYLALVPGAGVEYALSDRLTLRALELEYQYWPQFTFGALKPYGLSTGISFRLNGVLRYPKGARARR